MKATHQMLLASRLRDGRAVFLAAGGQWTTTIADGRVADEPPTAAALLEQGRAAERANQVVDPYLVGVTLAGGRPEPVDWREQIRAHGPGITPSPRKDR
jgi:hypothetical protein